MSKSKSQLDTKYDDIYETGNNVLTAICFHAV